MKSVVSRISLLLSAFVLLASVLAPAPAFAASSAQAPQPPQPPSVPILGWPDLRPAGSSVVKLFPFNVYMLRLTVKNSGIKPAPISKTTVHFYKGALSATQVRATPALAAGASTVVAFTVPAGYHGAGCYFRAEVESGHTIYEGPFGGEGNNWTSGSC